MSSKSTAGASNQALHAERARQLPFVSSMPVRFRDMDAMGHVNHAVYFTYMEVARSEYWFALTHARSVHDFSFIVLKAECLYRSPAVLGEVVVVKTGITRVGNTSFTMEYEIREQESNRHLADGSTELVSYDYRTRKPTRIPDDLRQRIHQFQQQLVSGADSRKPTP